MYDLIIVGGGPAGLTAGVYAARKKINALLLARDLGGQVMWTSSIENYMGYQFVEGAELMDKFAQQMQQFPIERLEGEEVTSITRENGAFAVQTVSAGVFNARAVILATGKKPRRLEVPGELELTGRGVSYCAVCDGPLFSGEKVAVVGGGNSALEAIDDLLKIADTVYSIAEIGFTGDAVLVDRVKDHARLVNLPGFTVTGIGGKNRVESISLRAVNTSENKTLEVHGVFIEIGLVPNSGLVKGLASLNSFNEIEVNCKTETSIPGLFAAGDVTNSPEKQIIIAAGDGAKAALQAHRYLQRLT